MIEVATAINRFASEEMQAKVPPSEGPVFILTSSQLQGIVTQAVKKAIQPLQDRIESQDATIVALEQKIAVMEATQETHADNQLIQLKLIAELREATKKEPQPLQKDRGEILRALIAANGGKMLAKDARQRMRMDKATFSRLLATLQDHIETKPLHQDKRRLLLIIK